MSPLIFLVSVLSVWSPSVALASPGRAPNSEQITCGLKGYDSGVTAYGYSRSQALANFSKCGSKCAADTRCKSFAFGNDECLLYRTSV